MRTNIYRHYLHKEYPINLVLSWIIAICFPLVISFPILSGRLAVLAALAGFCVLIKEREIQQIDKIFAIICLVIPCSLLLNMLLKGWALSYLGRPSYLIAVFLIFYLIGRFGIRPNTLFYAACAATIFALGIGLYEITLLEKTRASGIDNRMNSITFGNYSLLFGCFCLCGAFLREKTRSKSIARIIFGLIGFFSGVITSFISGSRGGWIALPFLLLFCLFYIPRISHKMRIGILAFFATLTLALLLGSSNIHQRVELAQKEITCYLSNPYDAKVRESSVGIRLAMWQWGIEKFIDNPLTGIGYAKYSKERETAVKNGDLPEVFGHFAGVHNELINTLAMGGLLAGVPLLAFWVLAWRFFYRRLKTAQTDYVCFYATCGLLTVLATVLFTLSDGLFGTSPSTKALTLSLAVPAGALRYFSRQEVKGNAE